MEAAFKWYMFIVREPDGAVQAACPFGIKIHVWYGAIHAFDHLSDDHRQIIGLVRIVIFQYGVFAEILDLPIEIIM